MGDRGSRRGPSWSVERRPGTGPSRAETRPWQAPCRRAAATGRRTRQGVERRPLLAVEEPGEPQREPADQARLDRRDRPQAVPGLPPQRGPAADLHDARRCRIPSFVKLQKSIVKHRARILAAIEHNLSNGLIESTNTKIRLITRMAFGFKSPEALIALALLSLGGHRPALPGRK